MSKSSTLYIANGKDNIPFFNRKYVIVSGICFVLILSSAISIYFYVQYRNTSRANSVTSTVNEVGRHLLLPSNEIPTLATVTDKTKLNSQEFFKNAANGDTLLIYAKAKEIILYRPPIDRIIAVSMNTEAFASLLGNIQQPLSLEIYNGTSTANEGTLMQKNLIGKISNITIAGIKNANQEYSKTIVIDVSNEHLEAASQLATYLGANLQDMPTNETKPNADLLVIVGKDYLNK